MLLHDVKKGKNDLICMAGHFYDGIGEGKPRKEAGAAAARSWIGFAAFEYGSDWGSYKRSANRSMDCFQIAGTRKWSCRTSARPCKRYVKSGDCSKTASR